MAIIVVGDSTSLQNAMLGGAQPGDTVQVRGTTYVTTNPGVGSDYRDNGGFTWGVSGLSTSNRITVTKYPGDPIPVLTNKPIGSTAYVLFPTMTFNGHRYITIEWLNIQGAAFIFTGGGTLVGGSWVGGGLGIIFQHCELSRGWETGFMSEGDGNWSPLRLENYDGTIIRNCLIRDTVVDAGVDPASSVAAIKLFRSPNTIIEYCTIRDTLTGTNCGGIDDKDTAVNSTIRYTWTENTPRGHRIQNQGFPATGWKMHNCVVIAAPNGSCFVQEQGAIDNYEVYKNTFIMNQGSVVPGSDDGMMYSAGDSGGVDGAIIHSNVIYGSTNYRNMSNYALAFGGGGRSNYNHYLNGSKPFRYRLPSTGADDANLSAYQSRTGLDLNATVGDPGFVDVSNKDFHLSAGSMLRLPANMGKVGGLSGGADIIKGAYDDTVKAIGHGAMAPTGLSVS